MTNKTEDLICPCCNKPVAPDKIELFQRNMARLIADCPEAADPAFWGRVRETKTEGE